MDLRKHRRDLPRVRADRDRAGVHDRDVVVCHPLGDVGGGQPRNDSRARLERNQLLDRRRRDHDVAVRQLDALRRPGRARRVDQREDVVRHDLGSRSSHVEARIRALELRQRQAARRRLAVDDDHMLELGPMLGGGQHDIEQPLLGDRDSCPCIAEQVGDLSRRIGRVDRERGGAEHRDREVDDVELDPVAQQQRNRVAALDTETREARRYRVNALQQLRPGERLRVVQGPYGDGCRIGGRGAAQRVRHRCGVDRAAGLGKHAGLHSSPSSRPGVRPLLLNASGACAAAEVTSAGSGCRSRSP